MNRTPYELTLESRVSGARPRYRFHTADGVVSKQSFRDAELLLLESLWDRDLGRLLCPQSNYGVTGVVLADAADSVVMTETSARAARLCEHNSRENGVETSVSVRADLTTIDREFDAVAYAPKRYTPVAVAKRRVVDALSLLRSGGRLYLAASAETGLARYESQLRDVAASVEAVDERDGYRVLEATRLRTVNPATHVTPRTLRPTVSGETLALVTVPGVFARAGLDDGTRLLMEVATASDGDRVLDLACGCGAIGTYVARTADCEVWLSDDDAVATSCAECSLKASGVEGTVVTADCVEGVADRTFDRVFCNPPTHAGGGVLSELFAGVRDVLASGGEFTLVHHRGLSLETHLAPFRELEVRRTGNEHVVVTAKP